MFMEEERMEGIPFRSKVVQCKNVKGLDLGTEQPCTKLCWVPPVYRGRSIRVPHIGLHCRHIKVPP